MKIKLLFLIVILSINTFAQIPAGYYNTATGSGYTLKTQLYNKIKGHINQTYAGLWTTYATSDRDIYYENDNTVIDMYSENPSGTDPVIFSYGTNQCGTYTTQGNCYNREHIVPQSVYNSASPMVSDAHFVIPVDGFVNGMRSNNPHGTVAVTSWTSLNGSKVGTSSVTGYTGTVFEPLNEFKGDIARMYFYFATRYENTVASYSFDMFNGTSNQVFTTPFLNMLMTWHNQDPVSQKEIDRNNAIYLRQNNRNPFIDHPEYVGIIWGSFSDTVAPTTPTNLIASNISFSSLTLTWTASTDNVGITAYDVYMNGVLKTTVTTTTTPITGLLSATNYSFYIVAKDATGNSSLNSVLVNTTTLPIIDTTPPTSPTSITASSLTGNSLTINWSNSSDYFGVTAYDIYLNGVFKTSVTSTTATISGLSTTTIYSIYVIAKDVAGNSSIPSATVTLKTCSCF
jgi:endonuclease I/chitodextrinase